MELPQTSRFLATLEIPHHRWWTKFRKSAFGIGLLAFVILCKVKGWFPDTWLGGALLLAGYCVAGDILRNFGGFVKAFAKDVAEAIKTVRDAFKNGG